MHLTLMTRKRLELSGAIAPDLRRILVMRFVKMHGLGNDYVYVNGFEHTVQDPQQTARRISVRHLGVGAEELEEVQIGRG